MEYVYDVSGSSAIKQIRFEMIADHMGILTVSFHEGREYSYGPVHVALYSCFISAKSKGQFYNNQVKGKRKRIDKIDE